MSKKIADVFKVGALAKVSAVVSFIRFILELQYTKKIYINLLKLILMLSNSTAIFSISFFTYITFFR
ncbi:MAG: hypothetical protein ACTSRG_09070 [Candidatus Helarchaeota archaeon]